jgi:type II secretory pathway predicted ATPase ExeA
MSVDNFLRHFGLTALPFARDVPPNALLRHKSFTEALSRLSFAVESRTPALFVADPGLGKSTLIGTFADSVRERMHVVYTPLCSCGPFGLVGQLAVRYGVRPKRSAAQTAQAVLDELAKSEQHEVLILDEGHRLPRESLEELRLISNLDYDRTPPFALILAGQSPLRDRVAEPDHVSLHQRLAIRTSLAPLTDQETTDYLDRRLRAVGAQATLFRPAAADKVFEKTGGVPRAINTLATASMLSAATAGKKHVDAAAVESAAFDLEHS